MTCFYTFESCDVYITKWDHTDLHSYTTKENYRITDTKLYTLTGGRSVCREISILETSAQPV